MEFFQENHRYYDAKHWKLADIADGVWAIAEPVINVATSMAAI